MERPEGPKPSNEEAYHSILVLFCSAMVPKKYPGAGQICQSDPKLWSRIGCRSSCKKQSFIFLRHVSNYRDRCFSHLHLLYFKTSLVDWVSHGIVQEGYHISTVRTSPGPVYKVNETKGCCSLNKYQEIWKVIAIIRTHLGHHKQP